jgi:hypothetical protein
MKSFVVFLFFISVYFISNTPAQTETKWIPLIITQSQRIWYQYPTSDPSNKNKIEVWILQMHQPPLSFQEIKEKIYRSKTLYGINLETGKYGIFRVIYYDIANNVIDDFDYHPDEYPDDMKYSYPIVGNSTLNTLLKKISNSQDNKVSDHAAK